MSDEPKKEATDAEKLEKPEVESEEQRDAAAQSACPMNHCCHLRWMRS